MPFVTETLWTALTGGDSVVVADWPAASGAPLDSIAAQRVSAAQKLITEVRRFRADQGVRPSQKVTARLSAMSAAGLETMTEQVFALARLQHADGTFAPTASIEIRLGAATVTVELDTSGTVDVAAERRRLEKDKAMNEKELAGTTARLANAAFVGKAPAEVVAKIQTRQDTARAEVQRIHARLQEMTALGSEAQ